MNQLGRIPGLHLLISSLPGSASRMHVESPGKPRDSISILKAGESCLVNLIATNRHVPIFLYILAFKGTFCAYGISCAGSNLIHLGHFRTFLTSAFQCLRNEQKDENQYAPASSMVYVLLCLQKACIHNQTAIYLTSQFRKFPQWMF